MDASPDEVEQAIEAKPVGLPKSMEHLNRQQMADYIIAALRKPQEVASERLDTDPT